MLESDGETSILISKMVLAYMQYHSTEIYPTWEKSDIRKWLNTTFVDEAFSANERFAIQMSEVKTKPYDAASEKTITLDEVYLLEYAEAKKYWKSNAERVSLATLSVLKENNRSKLAAYWWLRDPSRDYDKAWLVGADGYPHRHDTVTNTCGIRPVIRVKLSSIIQ